MHQEQRRRTQDLLREKGISHALFAGSSSIKWLTGFSWPIELGPNLHAGGSPLVWYDDGEWTLIVVNSYTADAQEFAKDPGCTVVSYRGYTIQQPITGAANLATAVREIVFKAGIQSGKAGVEEYDVPASVMEALRSTLPSNVTIVPIDGWLEPLRMIKTGEELQKLRDNFALTDIGHAAARKGVRAGRREIDVWNDIHSAVQQAAGKRVPLGNDLVVGYRQANGGGWPLDLEIRPHDSVIVDLSTILHGYWSDSCATYYAGEPTDKQVAMHHTIEEALAYAISLIKPGAVARDIDQKVRKFIEDAGYPVYGHHTGHAVGVTGHEAPRIVPYNEEVLEPGMVILLEPGIYYPGETGVRLEDAVLVTPTGAEVLTHHDKSLP